MIVPGAGRGWGWRFCANFRAGGKVAYTPYMVGSLVLLLASRHSVHHPPVWFDRTVAGYVLKNEMLGVVDPRSGFYVVRDGDCDGAFLSLTLTRDRHIVKNAGYRVPSLDPTPSGDGSRPLATKRLSPLSTGKGVAIGFSPSRVAARLGHPTKIQHSGDRKQFLDYVYRLEEKASGASYEQTYTFKQGRLIQIEFSSAAGGG
jgi:hypothetical protein